jgi:hypothetical protein
MHIHSSPSRLPPASIELPAASIESITLVSKIVYAYCAAALRPPDPARALAFAMALHGRLGRDSPARRLDDTLARHIAAGLAAAHPHRRVRL